MLVSNYFTPVASKKIQQKDYLDKSLSLRKNISLFNPAITKNLDKYDIIFFSFDNNTGMNVRNELYSLAGFSKKLKIIDLGFLKGDTKENKVAALREAMIELIKLNKIIIILGENKFFSYSVYAAYEFSEKFLSLTEISPFIKLKSNKENVSDDDFLNKIILYDKHKLFHFTNIGYQIHYTNENIIDRLNKKSWEAYRLSKIKADINSNEYLLRNAEFISFDMQSVRHIDAPDVENPVTNGFSALDACKLSYYSGISDELCIFSLWNIKPDLKNETITTKLAAQIIWYFISGYINRFNDFPDEIDEKYKKIMVPIENTDKHLVFYNNKNNERWWFEVPLNDENYLVPCSKDDYIEALKGDIPIRWIKFFNKV